MLLSSRISFPLLHAPTFIEPLVSLRILTRFLFLPSGTTNATLTPPSKLKSTKKAKPPTTSRTLSPTLPIPLELGSLELLVQEAEEGIRVSGTITRLSSMRTDRERCLVSRSNRDAFRGREGR